MHSCFSVLLLRVSNGSHIHFFKVFAVWSVSWKECVVVITVDQDLEAASSSSLSLPGKAAGPAHMETQDGTCLLCIAIRC